MDAYNYASTAHKIVRLRTVLSCSFCTESATYHATIPLLHRVNDMMQVMTNTNVL